jgi:GNAT superfamily N-acetyltransferase
MGEASGHRSAAMTSRVAGQADLDQLSVALADAFEDDPVFTWLLPRSDQRRARLVRFFGLELRHIVFPAGRVFTTDELPGASLELPTDAWKMPVREQVRHGPAFMQVFGTRLGHAMALITLMERRHLREPHYYIPYVGVAPPNQGRGLGTTLMRPTLDRCDREGVPAYLEATSERNVALYLRLGFEHLDEIRLGGSPPLWRMRRPPATPPRP